jgi:hypothetical protein
MLPMGNDFVVRVSGDPRSKFLRAQNFFETHDGGGGIIIIKKARVSLRAISECTLITESEESNSEVRFNSGPKIRFNTF